jgi:hypothetical protein
MQSQQSALFGSVELPTVLCTVEAVSAVLADQYHLTERELFNGDFMSSAI